MKVLKDSKALRRALASAGNRGRRVGFVPTMGFLHQGHLSLVRRARRENDIVVASIFVNPLQFGPKEDLDLYPRDFAHDKKLLEHEKTDFLFAPLAEEFYKADFQTSLSVKKLSRPLCGLTRPTHFAGVCTVVLKLLNSVMPDTLYLGQKDYQQFCVIKQLVRDLDFPVKITLMPIVREADGLAMSSRNVRLSLAQRQEAPLLYQSLKDAQRRVKQGPRAWADIKQAIHSRLKGLRHGRIDYVEIVDAQTLESVIEFKAGSRVLAAAAVFFGKTRLIDNVLIKVR
ncbi:MAG: pantoate--beta-alanine ligase [Candidatus Omnitrophica bacterium CG07_land_8_20_14_0_80_50_8]|nr:MAG: pantoate--beta-alanine ligase [Candidatus Omnitrophica bacterium CG07_land_8_20_14_0_80_50_8]